MKEPQPSPKEYSRIYDKIIKKAAKNEFRRDIYTLILLLAIFAIREVLDGRSDFFNAAVKFTVLWLMIASPSPIQIMLSYYCKSKEEFADIETLKKAYRKLIRDMTKKILFIRLGIGAMVLVYLSVSHFLHHGFTWGAIQIYIFLLVVFGILFLSTICCYKDDISEKRFKEIELEVEENIRKKFMQA
ncbi:MAG: hypothetical protein PQ964_05605 [Methanobacteriaceae archaeon]